MEGKGNDKHNVAELGEYKRLSDKRGEGSKENIGLTERHRKGLSRNAGYRHKSRRGCAQNGKSDRWNQRRRSESRGEGPGAKTMVTKVGTRS